MKVYRIAGLALLAFLTASWCLAAEAPKDDPTAKLIRELRGEEKTPERSPQELEAAHAQVLAALLPKLGSEKLDERQNAQQPYQAICWRASRPGAEAERAAAAKAILAGLAPDLPQPTLVFLLTQLENIGQAECAKTLGDLLDHKDTLVREHARRALQKNPAPEALGALRAALGKATEPAWRVALINALGARCDKASVAPLLQDAASDDESVRIAAVEALARIGDKAAVGAIAQASKAATTPRAWNAAITSYLLLADKLCEQGEKAVARSLYRNLLDAKGHIKCGAIIGLGRAGGAEDMPAIFEALASTDAKVRAAATAALALLPAGDVNTAVTEKMKGATPEVKVALLRLLAERGDKGVTPTLLAAAADAEEAVRIAAFEALGQGRDEAAIPPLLAALAKAKDRELQAVRTAINRIPGDTATAAIAKALGSQDPKLRVELVQVLADRRAEPSIPALLAAAEDPDERVRLKAIEALGGFAGEKELPRMTTLLVKAQARDREAAEKAVTAVAGRIRDEAKRSEPVLAALTGADAAARGSLLRVLGRLGGEKALPYVRTALKDENADIQNAAIRALADWPDATTAPDLLDIARTSQNQTHQVLALRAFVRVVGLPSDRSAAETLKLLDEAMKAARRPDEKKLVLAGLAEVPTPAALKMIEPCLDDPALKGEATTAYVKVASGVAGSDRDGAMAALKKVLDITKDEGLRKQAQEAINQIEKFEDYITAWEVSGPYTQQGKDGPALFDVAFAPEKELAGAEAAAAPGEQPKWKLMPVSSDPKQPWLMDLAKAVGGENRVAYLRTRVFSPKAQEALLELGSDDGVKVWLNGKLIHGNNASRSCKPGEDRVRVALNEGWNAILLKINNGGTDWGACARLRAPDGARLPGLRVSIEGK